MLFSIIIPTYNYADFLQEALDSLLKQHYTDYEVIVVDDGSTDHTQELLGKYKQVLGDKLTVLKQHNAGPGAARNAGVNAARGEYCLFLDADDKLTPDALAHFRKAIAHKRDVEMIIAGHNSIEGDTKKVFPGSQLNSCGMRNLQDYFRKNITLCNGAMVIAKKILQKIHFPESLKLCEDIPFFAQAIAVTDSITIPHAVVDIRKHGCSRRHDVDALVASVENLPGLIFNPDVMPTAYYRLKREVTGRMYLRVFRALYQCDRYREARKYYYKALKAYPRLLFLGNYYKKFLKSFLHIRQTPKERVI